MNRSIKDAAQRHRTYTKNDISCDLIISDGYISGDRATTGTHFHAFYEVHYILSGSVHFIIDEKDIVLEEGAVCIIPPQVIHRIYEKEGSKRIGIRFSFANRKCDLPMGHYKRFEKAFHSLSAAHIIHDTPVFKRFIQASRTLLAENAPAYVIDEFLFMAIDQLTYSLNNIPFKENIPNTDYSDSLLAAYIEDYLNRNYRGEPNISALADLMDMSVRQTQRTIKRLFGKTYSELLLIKRLTVAKFMLRSSQSSLDEIAQGTGFCNKQYLCKKFSDTYGISPAKYRAIKQQGKHL